MIVGLTGRSCSGKDRVASLLDDRFTVIDEDGLGHVALDANRDRIVEAFGEDILTEGKVDRKKLGPKVFSSPEALKTLESISHPWMVEETLRGCREAEKEGKIPVINAAILEKIVVKKESTKNEIHLDIFLKLGARFEAVYDPRNLSASINRAKNTTRKLRSKKI